MSNFEFLRGIKEYALFASAAIEAEKVYASAPAMCAVGCRKALELAVKWVYSADNTMCLPYRDNLQALIHEPTFRFAMDNQTWGKLPLLIKLGNLAVHTEKNIAARDALVSLRGLFEFIQWVDYCYGSDYVERKFDEKLIPVEKVVVDTRKIKEQESLLGEKDAEIEALRKQIEKMSAQFTAEKTQHQQQRTFTPEDLTEFQTRKVYIDTDLKTMGWNFNGIDVQEEFPVDGMGGIPGQTGYVDYVLFGRDGLPLAVVEAKRSSKDPNTGRKQATLYADCLEQQFGQRPMIFTTNGLKTYFWDDQTGPQREVYCVFNQDDLQKLMNRRQARKDLLTVSIDDKITDRYYQKEAIRAVCEQIGQGFRKHLLVMATGTGKTRTAASLADVLSRGEHATNILFLADRTALVKQAKDGFKNYLPDMSLCNLCTNKDDRNARIVFSTYPTILNAIQNPKGSQPLFTPAHFDLIIIDESHRSIFKKYREIFVYFDAILVGLTATPKTDVDRNTYDFFEMEHGVPTYAYDYETAVYQDHVLVPYYNYEVKTKFLHEGITYKDLSEEGTLLCLLGATLGSTLVFLVVRRWGVRVLELYFPREKIESLRFMQNTPKVRVVAFLLMFIPGTPKDLISYCMGLTKIRLSEWIILSTVARIPSIVTSTVGGDALGGQDYRFAILVFTITLAISLLGGLIYSVYTKRHSLKSGPQKKGLENT